MRFATIRRQGVLTGARLDDDRLVLLDAADPVDAFLRRDTAREIGELPAHGAHYAQVSPRPGHILCLGLNYRSHIREPGRPTPQYPALFAKYASTLTGPLDDIVLPAVSDHVDGEVELAVVVGRTVRRGDMMASATRS